MIRFCWLRAKSLWNRINHLTEIQYQIFRKYYLYIEKSVKILKLKGWAYIFDIYCTRFRIEHYNSTKQMNLTNSHLHSFCPVTHLFCFSAFISLVRFHSEFVVVCAFVCVCVISYTYPLYFSSLRTILIGHFQMIAVATLSYETR